MGKRTIDSGHKQNHADFEECNKIMEKLETALDSQPIDFNKINEVLYTLTNPSFKYPNVEKCCETCTALEKNERWRKALDTLKTLEGKTDPDEVNEIFQKGCLNLTDGYGYFQDKDSFTDWRWLFGKSYHH